MGKLVALVVGYLLGAKTAGKDLDDLTRSVKALADTEEFGDVMAAARSHLGHTLRELASLVDGDQGETGAAGSVDLVDRVKRLVERN